MGATAPFTQVTHEAATEALTLRRDTISLIDADNKKERPSSEDHPK
jgi:hypothetical protein